MILICVLEFCLVFGCLSIWSVCDDAFSTKTGLELARIVVGLLTLDV